MAETDTAKETVVGEEDDEEEDDDEDSEEDIEEVDENGKPVKSTGDADMVDLEDLGSLMLKAKKEREEETDGGKCDTAFPVELDLTGG